MSKRSHALDISRVISSDDSSHVCSVRTASGTAARIRNKNGTVNVIDNTVAVIINAVIRNFFCVNRNTRRQLSMTGVDKGINNGDNHVLPFNTSIPQ
ncbi:hypothetical protein D3C87_1640040 [compost metagenome]